MNSEKQANFRNSVWAKSEVSGFVEWVKKREDVPEPEKERLARLLSEYQGRPGLPR